MTRRLAGIALVVTALSALVCSAGSAGAAARSRHAHATRPHIGGVLIRANSHEALPLHGGTVDSTNWSGYAVTPASDGITAVSSSFVVPSASIAPPGFAATWTGIGGYSSTDLIQAGVAEQSLPSLPVLGDQYYAWYELLPNAETQLTNCSGDSSCTVTPGDTISVTISQDSGSTWTIAVIDQGNWSWTQEVSYQSSNSSAEWIQEAPTIEGLQSTMANIGTAEFGPTSTFVQGGHTYTIAEGSPTQIVLSPGLINEATPSSLAPNGQSFDVCAYAQTCATP